MDHAEQVLGIHGRIKLPDYSLVPFESRTSLGSVVLVMLQNSVHHRHVDDRLFKVKILD